MTINLNPSNECLDWTQMLKAMQFHATELQMNWEFAKCQHQAVQVVLEVVLRINTTKGEKISC